MYESYIYHISEKIVFSLKCSISLVLCVRIIQTLDSIYLLYFNIILGVRSIYVREIFFLL